MERLAKAILLAAKLREESWDDKAEKYKTELGDACDEAAESVGFSERGTQPVYLMLRNSWNESLDWANKY